MQTLSFVYDAESRLVGVSRAASASFVYDGRRVKATVNGVASYYVGDHYEVSGGVVKQYYSASVLHWLLTDHLGGTAHTISGTTETGELRYHPFGVTRFTSGGSQYASHDYQTRLQAVQTQVSMRRRGNCYDNALLESCWATLKTELVEEQPFASHAAARCDSLLYIEGFYNLRCRHLAPGNLSPMEFERRHLSALTDF